jgi:hypothetical protein
VKLPAITGVVVVTGRPGAYTHTATALLHGRRAHVTVRTSDPQPDLALLPQLHAAIASRGARSVPRDRGAGRPARRPAGLKSRGTDSGDEPPPAPPLAAAGWSA